MVNFADHSGQAMAEQAWLGQKVTQLRMFSPYQIALLIRNLDSKLINIEYKQAAEERCLVYQFAVAGRVRAFPVPLNATTLDSIADLYPAALAFEQKLQDQWGLVFRPHSEENPSA